MGSIAYMSHEEAEGVLYEMVTGARAFQGETNFCTLAAILRSEPGLA